VRPPAARELGSAVPVLSSFGGAQAALLRGRALFRWPLIAPWSSPCRPSRRQLTLITTVPRPPVSSWLEPYARWRADWLKIHLMAARKHGPWRTGLAPGRTNRDRVLWQTTPGKYHCTLEGRRKQPAWSHSPAGPRQAPSHRPSRPPPIQRLLGKTEHLRASYGFDVPWQVGCHRQP
jgi:hypothetical protein